MRNTAELPTTGQFVALWQYNGKPWSKVCEYGDDGYLYIYKSTEDEWVQFCYGERASSVVPWRATNVMYIVVEQEDSHA